VIDQNGRRRIAEQVRAQMGWLGLSGVKVSATGRVSRATLDRVKRCEAVSDNMLRALGDVLGLPRDYLLYVGQADVDAVMQSAAEDPDLVRWTLSLIESTNDHEMATHRRTRVQNSHFEAQT
jgi:hypothetical protein